MKKNFVFLITSFLISVNFLFFSCKSTQQVTEEIPPAAETAPVQEEIQIQNDKPLSADSFDTAEPEEADEYTRSVGTAAVSKDTFEADKKEIIRIIDELSVIMAKMDYRSWLKYIDSESIKYWQKPANLRKAQGKLPVKGLQLKSLEDYFKYVFVPARRGRSVSEIRYESDTYVKAVEITEKENKALGIPEHYLVFYYFNKINGKWMLHLPEITD